MLLSSDCMLPKYLTTVTPLSKLLAMALFVAFPFVGFYLGVKYKGLDYQAPVVTSVPQPKRNPTPTETVTKCEVGACILDGNIYFIDEKGKKKEIARPAEAEDAVGNTRYDWVELSPNKRFILAEGVGWESIFFEIFDVVSGKKYELDVAGERHWWLDDNRLMLIGGCGMGFLNCGEVSISKSGSEPWVLKKVGNVSGYLDE